MQGLYAFLVSTADTAIHEPAGLLRKPFAALKEHGLALNRALAAEYEVNIEDIRLPETVAALSSHKFTVIAGEATVEVVAAIAPAVKLGKVIYEARAIRWAARVPREIESIAQDGRLLARQARRVERLEPLGQRALKAPAGETRAESELAQIGRPTTESAREGVPARPGRLGASTDVEAERTATARKIIGGGIEDRAFNVSKSSAMKKRGHVVYDEADFEKGTAGIRGRKPTPDGLSVDPATKTKIYWEDKRPSEWDHNSWRSTYENDPIAEQREAAVQALKDGKISEAHADARIVIAEHDDHFLKKGARWNDPTGIQADGYTEKLGLRLPDIPGKQDAISAFTKRLAESGRNPVVIREDGIVCIIYDVPK